MKNTDMERSTATIPERVIKNFIRYISSVR
jgi:hypothetical protein